MEKQKSKRHIKFFLKRYLKMEKTIPKFGDSEIEKKKKKKITNIKALFQQTI